MVKWGSQRGPAHPVESVTVIEADGSHHGHLDPDAETGALAQVGQVRLAEAVPDIAHVQEGEQLDRPGQGYRISVLKIVK